MEIKFQIIETSEHEHVYELMGIPHWRFPNDSALAEFVEREPTKIIYDEQEHCIKKVKIPEYPKLVTQRCNEPQYIDPGLKGGWKVLLTSEDPTKNATEENVFEFHDRTHSYIYCYPNKISYFGSPEKRCPVQPFKLNVNVPYNITTFNKTWVPYDTNITLHMSYADVIDTIHPGHFLEEFEDDTPEDLLKLRQSLKKSHDELKSLAVKVDGMTMARILSWTMWISIFSFGILIIYCCNRLGMIDMITRAYRVRQAQVAQQKLQRTASRIEKLNERRGQPSASASQFVFNTPSTHDLRNLINLQGQNNENIEDEENGSLIEGLDVEKNTSDRSRPSSRRTSLKRTTTTFGPPAQYSASVTEIPQIKREYQG